MPGRAALGAGLGFLLADRLTEDGRKAVGWTLLLVGALSTVPLAFEVLGGGRLSALDRWLEPSESGSESESQESSHAAGCAVADLKRPRPHRHSGR